MGLAELEVAIFKRMLEDMMSVKKPEATGIDRGRGYRTALELINEWDFQFDIPRHVIALAEEIMKIGASPQDLEASYAADYGGKEWLLEAPHICLNCGRQSSWRQVLLPDDYGDDWRLNLPINHVPLCGICVKSLKFSLFSTRNTVATWLWGPRYVALKTYITGKPFPEWDRIEYPLWPPSIGGKTAKDGAGLLDAISYRTPANLLKPVSQRSLEIRTLLGMPRRKYTRRFVSSQNLLPGIS